MATRIVQRHLTDAVVLLKHKNRESRDSSISKACNRRPQVCETSRTTQLLLIRREDVQRAGVMPSVLLRNRPEVELHGRDVPPHNRRCPSHYDHCVWIHLHRWCHHPQKMAPRSSPVGASSPSSRPSFTVGTDLLWISQPHHLIYTSNTELESPRSLSDAIDLLRRSYRPCQVISDTVYTRKRETSKIMAEE